MIPAAAQFHDRQHAAVRADSPIQDIAAINASRDIFGSNDGQANGDRVGLRLVDELCDEQRFAKIRAVRCRKLRPWPVCSPRTPKATLVQSHKSCCRLREPPCTVIPKPMSRIRPMMPCSGTAQLGRPRSTSLTIDALTLDTIGHAIRHRLSFIADGNHPSSSDGALALGTHARARGRPLRHDNGANATAAATTPLHARGGRDRYRPGATVTRTGQKRPAELMSRVDKQTDNGARHRRNSRAEHIFRCRARDPQRAALVHCARQCCNHPEISGQGHAEGRQCAGLR